MVSLFVTRSVCMTQNGYLKAPNSLKNADDDELIEYANQNEDDVKWDEIPEEVDRYIEEYGDIYFASVEKDNEKDCIKDLIDKLDAAYDDIGIKHLNDDELDNHLASIKEAIDYLQILLKERTENGE